MLEAIDIVLICLGTALSILALVTLSLLLFIRWRNSRYPSSGVSKGYRSGEPPMLNSSLKNGAITNVIVPVPPADKPQKAIANGNRHPEMKPAQIPTNIIVGLVNENVEIKTNGDIHDCRASHSIKRPHRPTRISLSPNLAKAAQVEAVQTEHTVDDFIEDLKRIRSGSDSVLYEEFQILESWDTTREKSCCAAENARTRNRFADILPYDDSRVILRGRDDYINASLVDGYHTCGQFIATQGPIGPEEIGDGKKESTVNHFWRMIWEKNVQCVLMLTDCVENMRQRCAKYWPPLGETQRYGDVEVDLVSECEDPVCIQRELNISTASERRQVSQFHFLNWSDAHGPENTVQLLDFIDRVARKQFRKPIVVHCSAGVGRTGVLIALWRLLEQARQDKVIDVFGTVDALRQQRSRMVQTPEQYLSLYEALSLVILDQRL
ncbi:hypothetical protein KIN20_001058 [Parelaphostrongylus tenuis]|uniref:protein-tyrosine-phosphatase n=1 Tax=Parelaphostrongylus tenuis TaxID=148309 RepID=A0AAD5QG07_PARTN|nr:hypothetical protein KIN20_001058 [Parelaphostrongylus tenuis]